MTMFRRVNATGMEPNVYFNARRAVAVLASGESLSSGRVAFLMFGRSSKLGRSPWAGVDRDELSPPSECLASVEFRRSD